MKCVDCTGPAAFEGYCEECLYDLAASSTEPEKPAMSPTDTVSLLATSKKRMHEIEVSDDVMERHRHNDPAMSLEQHRAAMAYIAAVHEFESFSGIHHATIQAWHSWIQWETVQRRKAQRKAS